MVAYKALVAVVGLVMVLYGALGVVGLVPSNIICGPDCPTNGNGVDVSFTDGGYIQSNIVKVTDTSTVAGGLKPYSLTGFIDWGDGGAVAFSSLGGTFSHTYYYQGGYTITDTVKALFLVKGTAFTTTDSAFKTIFTDTGAVGCQPPGSPVCGGKGSQPGWINPAFGYVTSDLTVTVTDKSVKGGDPILPAESISWGLNQSWDAISQGQVVNHTYAAAGSYLVNETASWVSNNTVGSGFYATLVNVTVSSDHHQKNSTSGGCPPTCPVNNTTAVVHDANLVTYGLIFFGFGLILAAFVPGAIWIRILLAGGLLVVGMIAGYLVGGL